MELRSEPLSRLTCVSAEPGSTNPPAHTHTGTAPPYPNTATAPPPPGEPVVPPGSLEAPLHCRGDPSPLKGPSLGGRWSHSHDSQRGQRSDPKGLEHGELHTAELCGGMSLSPPCALGGSFSSPRPEPAWPRCWPGPSRRAEGASGSSSPQERWTKAWAACSATALRVGCVFSACRAT